MGCSWRSRASTAQGINTEISKRLKVSHEKRCYYGAAFFLIKKSSCFSNIVLYFRGREISCVHIFPLTYPHRQYYIW